jgi:hypothetical protein
VLDASRHAFENFRYVYEDRVQSGQGWLAGGILNSVVTVILEEHPEWNDDRGS